MPRLFLLDAEGNELKRTLTISALTTVGALLGLAAALLLCRMMKRKPGTPYLFSG